MSTLAQILDHRLFVTVVEAAIRAPSMHNTQPWRFRLRAGAVEVLADPVRRLVVADPRGWGVRLACGAAVLNARLALAATGHAVEVAWNPEPGEPNLLARLTPVGPYQPSPRELALYAAIPHRYSNRHPFAATPVPPEIRRQLVDAARTEHAWLDLLIGRTPLAVVSEVVRAADTTLIRNPAYRQELAVWSRSGDDGVPAQAGGPSPEPQDLLAMRDFGGRARPAGRDFESDPLVAVLGTAGDTVHDQLVAGQALQRVLLTATETHQAVSMLSQPIEVPTAREHLRRGLGRLGTPQMVLRIGFGRPGYPTRRRPVTDVIDP
jgi:hypothetical protein